MNWFPPISFSQGVRKNRLSSEILYFSAGVPAQGAPHPFMAAHWLGARGYNVRVVCRHDANAEPINTPLETVPYLSFGGSTANYIRGALVEMLRARSAGKQTIFYLHGHNTTPAAYLALLGVNRRRIIYHTQDYIEPGRYPLWEFFERRMTRRAGWVISNEPNRARFLSSHCGLRQMPIVVPTALPKDWPRPGRDQTLRSAILAHIGRQDSDKCRLVMHEGGYSPVRCGRQLVEAFRSLPEDYVLVFTGMAKGCAARGELDRSIADFGMEKRIVVLERLSFEGLMRHTACCDLGILLYPNDGIGNFYQCPGRLTHYLGCGLPIVASNFPGLELLALKHNLGAICDPESPAAIAEAIRAVGEKSKMELATDAERLKQLAKGELAYETHAWRIEEVVRKIIKSHE